MATLVTTGHLPLCAGLAGAQIGRSTMFVRQLAALAAISMMASPALADCKNQCFVGALGNGGDQSNGKARGFRYVGPGPINPAFTLTNDGLSSEGHVEVLDADGNVIGTLNGRCEAGTFIWNGTGSGIFGDWTGSSEIDFIPCD